MRYMTRVEIEHGERLSREYLAECARRDAVVAGGEIITSITSELAAEAAQVVHIAAMRTALCGARLADARENYDIAMRDEAAAREVYHNAVIHAKE